MKRFTAKTTRILLILCLCTALFTVSASAADITLQQGVNYIQEYIWGPSGSDGNLHWAPYVGNPGIIPGMTVNSDDYGIYISGTPSATGYYSTSATVECDNFSGSVPLNFTVNPNSVVTSYTGSFTATQNVSVPESSVVTLNETVYSCNMVSGRLPTGLNYRQYDTYFTLYGTPTESGYFTAVFSCTTSTGTCSVTLNINIIAAPSVLTVTKSPSGETVEAGGNAAFISTAEAYSDVEWRIVSADGSVCYRNKSEIEARFPGVQVAIYQDDTGREWLSLKNIPISMNGFYIQTKFWSLDKTATAFTNERSCLLTVKQKALQAPVITTQPASLSQTVGTASTLSVYATDPNSGTLKYQWYKNTTNSNAGGQAIMGATNASYTPPQTEGTLYYYATISSSKDNTSSPTVTTQAAAVTYTAAAAPSPTPGVSATPTPTPSGSPAVTANPQLEAAAAKKSSSLLQIFLLLAIMFLCLAAGVLIFLMRRDARKDDEYDDAEPDEETDEYEDDDAPVGAHAAASGRKARREPASVPAPASRTRAAHAADTTGSSRPAKAPTMLNAWICTTCGTENTSRFCAECGASRPEPVREEPQAPIIYFCENCGWTTPDPAHPPKFCIECGAPLHPSAKQLR